MTNKNKIINQAQKFIQKGQWDKAIKELQKLVAEDPSDVRTLLKLGDVFAKKGDREQATKVYKQVAESYSEQGFFLKAVAVYKQILKHDQKNLEVTLKLAELYEHLGLTSEAMVQYQVASQLHDETGNARDALDVLKRMVELDAENVASRIKLAESYSRENMVGDAIEQFQRAAEILKRQGRVDDYIKVAERLVYHDPNRIEVIKELANIYISRGDTKRGLAKLQLCFKAQPRDVETLTLLAGAFRDLGQLQKTVFVYRELSRIHQENGDDLAGRSTLQKILEIDPGDAEARAALGFGGNSTPNVFPSGSGSGPDRMNAGFGGNTGPLPSTFATQTGPMSAQAPSMFGGPSGSNPRQQFGGPTPASGHYGGREPSGTSPYGGPTPSGGHFATLQPSQSSPYGGPTPAGGHFGGPFGASSPRAPSIQPRPAPPPRADQIWRAKPPQDEAVYAGGSSDERLDFGSAPRAGLLEREGLLPPIASPAVPHTPPKSAAGDGVQISKILTETDVYIKYGLRDKALEHLRKIFELDPDNTLAYTKMRDIYASAGDTARAAEALANLIHIHSQQGNQGAAEATRAELERLAPGHPLIAGNVSPTAWAFGQEQAHAEIDSIDITEDSDVYDLSDVAEEPATEHDSLDAWLQQDPSAEDLPSEHETEQPERANGPFSLYPEFGSEAFDEVSSESVHVADKDIVDSASESGIHNRYAEPEQVFSSSFETEATESGVRRTPAPVTPPATNPTNPTWQPAAASKPSWQPNSAMDPFDFSAELDAQPKTTEHRPDTERNHLHEAELDPFELRDTASAPAPAPARLNTEDLDLGLSSPIPVRDDELEILPEEDLPEASVSAVVALDDLSKDLAFRPTLEDQDNDAFESAPEEHRNGANTNAVFAAMIAEEISPEDAQQIEDELDEAEFLAQQGLEEEAREALESVLARVPTHSRAQSIRATFDDSQIGLPKPDGLDDDDDDDSDPETDTSNDISDDDLSSAFDNLGASSGEDNPEDHYDEGMAYKELGRWDDAISHFKSAVRSPTRAIASLEMIGQCLLSKNDFEGAINSFWSALERGPVPEAATNLKYEIANAYEAAGDLQQAVTWYHACWTEDPAHRDVADRLLALGIDPDGAAGEPVAPQNGASNPPSSSDLPGPTSKKSKISYL